MRQLHHFTDVETEAQSITCPRSQKLLIMEPEFKPRSDQLQSHGLHHSALLYGFTHVGLLVYPFTLGSRLLEGGDNVFSLCIYSTY